MSRSVHVGATSLTETHAGGQDDDTEDSSLEEAVVAMMYADIGNDPEI